MGLFNSVLTSVFDKILLPLSVLSPEWGLVIASLVSGVVLLLLYGRLSDQKGLRDTKRRIGSCLLEAVLYRRDIVSTLRAQAKMFLFAFVYLRYAAIPILVLMVPCIILLAQFNERYGYRGLQTGERAIVKAKFEAGVTLDQVSLQLAKGLQATPPVRVESDESVYWGVETLGAQSQPLELQVKAVSQALNHEIRVGETQEAISTFRSKNWLLALLYPAGAVLPIDGPFAEIRVGYPERRYMILGMRMHWIVVFLIFSILAGVVGSRLFGVEI